MKKLMTIAIPEVRLVGAGDETRAKPTDFTVLLSADLSIWHVNRVVTLEGPGGATITVQLSELIEALKRFA